MELPVENVEKGLTHADRDLLKNAAPELYRKLKEIDQERMIYKENEHAYRRFQEKEIVKKLKSSFPASLDLDIALLYKAHSFISGDFCNGGKYIGEKFLFWMGDSISHGTGSSIVKDIINETVIRAFTLFRNKHEYSLQALIQRIQTGFSSPRVVREIMEADLSDIITGNDYISKLAIMIPVIFLQIESIDHRVRMRICNKGMPFLFVMKFDKQKKCYNKGILFSKSKTFEYTGKYKDEVKLVENSGLPLMVDRDLYNRYKTIQLSKKKQDIANKENVLNLNKVSECYLEENDIVAVASDGVIEMTNENKEEYGINRFIDEMMEFFSNTGDAKDFRKMKEKFYIDVLRPFTYWDEDKPISGNGIEDDMTLFLVKVNRTG